MNEIITTTLRTDMIERLEFIGTREANGTLTCFDGKNYCEWPDFLIIAGLRFRLEETDDKTLERTNQELAWYVPNAE